MMQKQRFLFFILTAATLLLISSCNEIRFETTVVNEQIPLLAENDTTLPHAELTLSFTYPEQFRDEASLRRLQQIFTGTFFGDIQYDALSPKEAITRYTEAYRERYRALSNNYYEEKAMMDGEMPVWYWHTLDIRNELLHVSDSLMSYSVSYSDYEGGAHGSHRVTYTNIDLNRLTTLSEEDLFLPGYYRPLTEKIVAQLMKDNEVTEPDSLLMKGFFTVEDIVPNNNFWLSDSAIHYAYNQYEIAPYSMGVIDVTIPYSELTELLSPGGVITRYFTTK
ncbi:MAG TPA: DUF3298 domain-containing protein [Proteiniphilum sp.]|nr:DUF3298 domain-containing protein [Proteiniphilum sp.]HPJ49752.1 DUF3298 domain-containing protein [Proteiniphilum sp.]HPR19266.1 DUF3298 domain-containing protein [Proteiniphilum sp.]